MKYFLSLLSIMLVSIPNSYALSPQSGWYVGLFGGAGYTHDQDYTYLAIPPLFDFPSPVNVEVDFKVMGNGGAQIGWRCDQFRVEGEILYSLSGYNKLTLTNPFLTDYTFVIKNLSSNPYLRLRGQTNLVAGFINGFYDLYTPDGDVTVFPYVGLGIGYTYMQNEIKFYYNNVQIFPFNGSPLTNKFSKSAPALQGIVGLSYLLDDFTLVGTDLRFIRTRNFSTSRSGSSEVIPYVSLTGDNQLTQISWNFNFNYNFD